MRISDWSSDVCSSDLLHPRSLVTTTKPKSSLNHNLKSVPLVLTADSTGNPPSHEALGLSHVGLHAEVRFLVDNSLHEIARRSIGAGTRSQERPASREGAHRRTIAGSIGLFCRSEAHT